MTSADPPAGTLAAVSDQAGSAELALALERIRARVDARTRSGAYPVALDAQLERQFNSLVHDVASSRDEVDRAMRALQDEPPFNRARIETTSRLPGGSATHEFIGKVVSRQVSGGLQQVQLYRHRLEQFLVVLVDAYLDAATDRDHHWQVALDRLAEVEELAASYRSLERRVLALEARSGGRAEGTDA